jgi:hypothetical protein
MDGNRLVSQVWGDECHCERARGRIQRYTYQKIEGEDLVKAVVSRVDVVGKSILIRAMRKVGNDEDSHRNPWIEIKSDIK